MEATFICVPTQKGREVINIEWIRNITVHGNDQSRIYMGDYGEVFCDAKLEDLMETLSGKLIPFKKKPRPYWESDKEKQ